MEKVKKYITKNKKIVIPVAIIIILLSIGSIYLVVQANSNSSDQNSKQEMKETEKEDNKDLTDYVKNLKDLTVEINAKDIDFLKDVTYDKKVVKEVTVDTSKVDLSKEGKYDLTYSIIPVDTTNSKKTVIKTLIVQMISKEKGQKEAEIKKESKDKTATQKEEATSNQNKSNTTNNSNTQNTNKNSNNNSGGSTKPNTNNNNSGNSSSNDTKPVKPETPKHEHNFVYIPAQTHIEYETVTHTEEVPVYEYKEWYECNVCHAKFNTADEVGIHCGDVCGCGYSLKSDNVQTGTQTVITKEKVPHKVIDVPAYYKCECGETHQ